MLILVAFTDHFWWVDIFSICLIQLREHEMTWKYSPSWKLIFLKGRFCVMAFALQILLETFNDLQENSGQNQ